MIGPPNVTPAPKGTARVAKKKARRAKPSTDRKAAGELHALIVRSVGYCQAAEFLPDIPCYGRHEAAHFIRRNKSGTFTDLENAACCCQRHHTYLDDHPVDLHEFIDWLHGDGHHRRLQGKADAWTAACVSSAAFWRAERARLTEIATRRGLK